MEIGLTLVRPPNVRGCTATRAHSLTLSRQAWALSSCPPRYAPPSLRVPATSGFREQDIDGDGELDEDEFVKLLTPMFASGNQ